MTRAEAAAQAAQAFGALAHAGALMTYHGALPWIDELRSLAEEQLAAALLVLTDSAEAIRAFMDAPVRMETMVYAVCCGIPFVDRENHESHLRSPLHKHKP